jgi:hypothetical protein
MYGSIRLKLFVRVPDHPLMVRLAHTFGLTRLLL